MLKGRGIFGTYFMVVACFGSFFYEDGGYPEGKCEVKLELLKHFTKVSKNKVDEIIGISCTYYLSLSFLIFLLIFSLIYFSK